MKIKLTNKEKLLYGNDLSFHTVIAISVSVAIFIILFAIFNDLAYAGLGVLAFCGAYYYWFISRVIFFEITPAGISSKKLSETGSPQWQVSWGDMEKLELLENRLMVYIKGSQYPALSANPALKKLIMQGGVAYDAYYVLRLNLFLHNRSKIANLLKKYQVSLDVNTIT